MPEGIDRSDRKGNGMNQAEEYFSQILESGEPGHAYLFEAESDEAALNAARFAARRIACETKSGCGRCPSCRAFDSGNHPDIITLSKEKEAYAISEIRRQLVDDIQIRPYQFPYKIYIVPAFQKLSEGCQNAMLKTLEEPPAYGIILLAGTNRGALLPTVLSRLICLNADEDGEALLSAEEEEALSREVTKDQLMMLKNIERMRVSDINGIAKAKKTEKDTRARRKTAQLQAQIWEEYLRDIYLLKGSCPDRLHFPEERQTLAFFAERLSDRQLRDIWEEQQKAKKRISANVDAGYTMGLLGLKLRKALRESEE